MNLLTRIFRARRPAQTVKPLPPEAPLSAPTNAPPPEPSSPPPPSTSTLDGALKAYAEALAALAVPADLLPVLLARDAVEEARQKAKLLAAEAAQQLVALDARLQARAAAAPPDALAAWRQTLTPSAAAWWWHLDVARAKQAESGAQSAALFWNALAGTFILLTAALTAQILPRLWDGAPDLVSVFGSLVTLMLTASPLVKQGREIGAWFVEQLFKVRQTRRAEALAALTGLACVLVFVIRLTLPAVAVGYNNRGFVARQAQNYALAQRSFQRAVALDPDQVVAAYNLAEVYARLREPDKARDWYRRAIAADLDFAPAYRGLGRLYNVQGQPAEAQTVLAAGLAVAGDAATEADTVIRYELLAELGRAYFAQEQPVLAQRALEDAIALESALVAFEQATPSGAQYRLALPHYYLAQVYEQADRPQDALAHWEACLRLLKPGWTENMAWRIEAQERIAHLEEVLP